MDNQYRQILLQVILEIGFSFIFLSLLIKYSSKVLEVIGLIMIFGCNLLQYVPLNNSSVAGAIFSFFFSFNFYTVSPHFVIILAYPGIPWLGIMLVGFATGKLFELPIGKRKNIFLRTGFAAVALFIVLRFINIYGDPLKWSAQKNNTFTFLSFMNVTKYPPSLLYSLITLGIMFVVLYFSDGIKNKFTKVVIVYGKVPLFYYLIHLYIIHLILFGILFTQGYHWADFNFTSFNFGRPVKVNGLPLWGVYIVWICIVISLYPFCKWYGKYKMAHPEKKWMRYL